MIKRGWLLDPDKQLKAKSSKSEVGSSSGE